jgi:hypothetical protein
VKESAAGEPVAVGAAHLNPVAQVSLPVIKTARKQAVKFIEDRWRIDDEWWRGAPVSRFYYAVLFNSGQRLVIYKDLVSGQWYKQGY